MQFIKTLGLALVLLIAGLVPSAEARQKASYAILTDYCRQAYVPPYNYGFVSPISFGLFATNSCVPGSIPNSYSSGTPMPSGGTLANLHVVYGSGDPGNPNTGFNGVVITVYINTVATALSCTTNTDGFCNDDTDEVNVNEGDEMYVVVSMPSGAYVNTPYGYFAPVSVSLEKQ